MAKGWRCRTNYNVNPFVGLSGHNSVSPIGLPAYLCHVEFSVVQGLWLGSFLSVGRKKKIVSVIGSRRAGCTRVASPRPQP